MQEITVPPFGVPFGIGAKMRQTITVPPFGVSFGIGARPLLSPADFSYLGYWNMPHDLGGSTADWSQGLALRYVGGQQRLLSLGYGGAGSDIGYWVMEYQLNGSPNTGSGGAVPTITNTWKGADMWGSTGYTGSGARVGLYIDPTTGELWYTSVGDYPQGNYLNTAVNSMSLRTLNADGTCSNFKGFWGLQGVGARANYGGVRRVPQWFQSQYGVGPYVTGFGGYSSLYAQGLGASLGPFMAFIPDPRTVAGNPNYFDVTPTIPASAFKIGADCRSGSSSTDWGPNYAGRTKDRGVRVTPATNYFDSGAYTPGGGQAAAPTQWLSPMANDPNGWGRWAWCESYHGGAAWIDDDAGSRGKHGLVMVASVGTGPEYYYQSNRWCTGSTHEIHVYDPAQVAQVIAGTLPPFALRPTNAWEVVLPNASAGFGGDAMTVDAAFDPATNQLYLYVPTYANGARVHCFQVG